MELPITSFVELTQNVVEWGKHGILQNPRPEDPPALASQKRDPRVLAMKKAIPIELTEQEKKFDHTFTQYLFNEILIGKYLREIARQLIEEDHLLYFAQQERQKAFIQLLAYLREKAASHNIQQMENLLKLLQDNPAAQETMERILALQHLIAELEERKEALIAYRDKYVSEVVTSLAAKLGEEEEFKALTHAELESAVYPAIKVLLMDAEAKAKALAGHHPRYIAPKEGSPVVFGVEVIKDSNVVTQVLIQTLSDAMNRKHNIDISNKGRDVATRLMKNEITPITTILDGAESKIEGIIGDIKKRQGELTVLTGHRSAKEVRVETGYEKIAYGKEEVMRGVKELTQGKKEVAQGKQESDILSDILSAVVADSDKLSSDFDKKKPSLKRP